MWIKNLKNLSPSLIISLSLALFTWIIFYPGILSVDSIYTIREASTESISNVRSPFITMLLSSLLKVGGTIGTVTIIQTLSGFLGLRRLIFSITNLFSAQKIKREWIACLVILLLSSPLTPLSVYFATFWFDTWLVIFLLWVVALLLEFAKKKNLAFSRKDQLKIFSLVLLMTFAMLARPNSSILYPALALAFFSLLQNKSFSGRTLLFLALCPLILYLLFTTLQYRVIGVKQEHPERVAFALDLASMLTYDPSICQSLSPLPSCRIVQESFPPEFIVGYGAIDHTLNQGLGMSEPGFVELFTSPSLKQDLILVASRYPGIYSKVKVLNFLDYIKPRHQYYYQSFIYQNDFNLFFDPQFEFVRNKIFLLLHKIYQHSVLRYFSFVHLTWFMGNLGGILFFLIVGGRLHQYYFLALVLSIPATYYFSYLLAMTASDFRFMYPSLLLTQVIIVTVVFQVLVSQHNFIISLTAIVGRWRDTARRRSTETIRRA